MDFSINPKHLISFESNIEGLPRISSEDKINYQTDVFSNGTLIERYNFNTDNKSQSFNMLNSLFYLAEFNERTKLNVNFTYSNYQDDYINRTFQENYYDRQEVGINKKQYTRGYAELDYAISKKASLQVGYGNTWRELKNEFAVTMTDVNSNATDNFSSDFTLTDMRHKLYSNFTWKFNKKWSSRVGLASETSAPRVDGQQLNYVIFQPLFDLRYVAGKKINYTLKYRTTSAYPSISETNPFTSLVNPRITSTGNPFLRPSTIHRFSLRINILQGLLSLEPYTHYSNNRIVNVGELDASNMFNFRYENAQSYLRNGMKVNFSHFFKPGIIVQANTEIFHSQIVSSVKTCLLYTSDAADE